MTFSDQPLTAGTYVRAAHVSELRSALDAARSAIGLPGIAYTDPTIVAGSTTIKAAHVQQLRDGCK